MTTYLGVKPSFDRYKSIKVAQNRILPTKVGEDPEKSFMHKNLSDLENYYHTKQGVKHRIPIKEQGIKKEDIDPVGYTLDKNIAIKKIY